MILISSFDTAFVSCPHQSSVIVCLGTAPFKMSPQLCSGLQTYPLSLEMMASSCSAAFMDFLFCFHVYRSVCFSLLSHVNLEVSGMTDKERDQIDTDAETYMRTCSFAINSLKGEGMEWCNFDI